MNRDAEQQLSDADGVSIVRLWQFSSTAVGVQTGRIAGTGLFGFACNVKCADYGVMPLDPAQSGHQQTPDNLTSAGLVGDLADDLINQAAPARLNNL